MLAQHIVTNAQCFAERVEFAVTSEGQFQVVQIAGFEILAVVAESQSHVGAGEVLNAEECAATVSGVTAHISRCTHLHFEDVGTDNLLLEGVNVCPVNDDGTVRC